MAGFYSRFDVFSIDADGRRIAAEGLVLNAFNVTTDSLLGTVAADKDGVVEAGEFGGGASVGDVVEFSHPSYTFRRRITLAATLDDAFAMREMSDRAAFMLDNDGRRMRSDVVRYFATDLDDPSAAPVELGSGVAGETAYIQLQTAIPKRHRIFPISLTADKVSLADSRLREDIAKDVYIPAVGASLLWSEVEDKECGEGTPVLMYANVIPSEALLTDGDVVRAIYEGNYAANTQVKTLTWFYDDEQLFEYPNEFEGGQWRVEVDMIRRSATEIYLQAHIEAAGNDNVFFDNLLTVDDAADIAVVRLFGEGNSTTDIIGRAAYGRRMSAAGIAQTGYVVDDDGVFLVDDGGEYIIDFGEA